MTKRKALFHYDNAPAYTLDIATVKLIELYYEFLPQYTTVPFTSAFFLFSNLKESFVVKKFGMSEEEDLQKTYFSNGFKKVKASLKQVHQIKKSH